VYCPGVGWIDVDPTNGILPAEAHITVAYGRDYGDVSPIKGVFLGGGEHALDVSVDVVPIQSR
jgi:transglutaminase-like putative cysteine protease